MDVEESDLPGVGKKFTIDIGDGESLVIVVHNTGKRAVFLDDDPDEDNRKLFSVDDRLARVVGSVLEGAYFQPVASEEAETSLGDGNLIEWVTVDDDSGFVGRTAEEAGFVEEGGAAIVAISREGETFTGEPPVEEIQAGDTLVVVGTREDCREFIENFEG